VFSGSSSPAASPGVTRPVSHRGSISPDVYDIRRDTAFPVIRSSPIAQRLKDSIVPGATIGTLPEVTSSSETTPFTPP
jgi:hypothetical protein